MTKSVKEVLSGISYAGRGIVLGLSPSGRDAVLAYFISGRSENSRNRVFCLRDGELFTEAFDPSKVKDPSLIIYRAFAKLGRNLIVSNGDQTDTVYEALKNGKSFSEALSKRCFEPDAPNFTPRISGVARLHENDFTYSLSILKSVGKFPGCARQTFDYEATPGLGHFIRTYMGDGNPLPSFCGEPSEVFIPATASEFSKEIWEALDEDNRISLYVRYTDISSGKYEESLINKNMK